MVNEFTLFLDLGLISLFWWDFTLIGGLFAATSTFISRYIMLPTTYSHFCFCPIFSLLYATFVDPAFIIHVIAVVSLFTRECYFINIKLRSRFTPTLVLTIASL